jgi:Flp pilus assembly protein TadD
MALHANPDDPRAYFLLGAAYVEAGNDNQARQVYRKAQRFKHYLSEVYNNLGAIAYRQGDLKESASYLKRAVRRDPARARYRYNYALTLSAERETSAALQQIDEGIKLDNEYVELRYLRGVVLLKAGDADGARKSFEATLTLDENHEGARHNVAMLDEMERKAKEGEVVVEGRE